MSPLYKRKKSPYFYASFSVKMGGQLRQVRISTGERDRAVARYAAQRIEGEYRLREAKDSGKLPLTVGEFIKRHDEHAQATTQKSTLRILRGVMKKLSPYASKPMSYLTPSVVDGLIAELAKTLSPRTVNSNISFMRSAFRRAVRWDLIDRNPFEGVDPLPYQKEPPRDFTQSELLQLFVQIDRQFPRYSDLFRFYLHTGMRTMEPLTLEWGSVDWDTGYIRLLRTKGRKYRDVPMFALTRAILERRKHLPRPFPHSAREVESAFRLCARAAVLKDVRIHCFRRTFITQMLDRGIPLPAVQMWVGHIDAATTRDAYTGNLDRIVADANRINLEPVSV